MENRLTVGNVLHKYTTVFIMLFGMSYIPLDGTAGFGIVKLVLMGGMIALSLVYCFRVTKALIWGLVYLLYQYLTASFHPETWRWSTLLFSTSFVLTYVAFYNMVYVAKVFSLDFFIKICRWVIMTYFVVCIVQQCFVLVGFSYFPLVNLWKVLGRGIGCNSLSMEPSTFARTMLVWYYAYVKCQEYKRGVGPYSVRELFYGEHKKITLCFLWMMCSMGSGTAFVCLIAFSLYFVRKSNFYFVVPLLILLYIGLNMLEFEQLNRATSVINATTTMDQATVEATDGSAASRISPLLNSFHADFSKLETWFGKGIDYAVNHNLILTQKATLFDDYGFLFYILTLCLNFSCGYRFWSLATLFMFMGIGGTSGGNIHYLWELMMVMTCVRYFYETRFSQLVQPV